MNITKQIEPCGYILSYIYARQRLFQRVSSTKGCIGEWTLTSFFHVTAWT
jgi:hypothetical protein